MGKEKTEDSKAGSNKTGVGPTKSGTNSTQPDNVVSQCITEKTPYFVVMAYHNPDKPSGTEAFQKAAEFKKKRIQRLYPKAVIDIHVKVVHTNEFINIWNGIDTKIKECPNHLLKEVHFFGHSGIFMLYFHGKGDNLTYERIKELKPLPWDQGYANAALVLHSCRTAQFDWHADSKDISSENCIAKELSVHLNARVVGQVPGATFNTGTTANEWKYRNSGLKNSWEIDIGTMNPDIVLWGYAAGTTVEKKDGRLNEYQKFLVEKIRYGRDGWERKYFEVNNQIWPCRAFQPGKKFSRVVEKDKFNQLDLLYI